MSVIEKIEARCDIVDTGFFLDGKPSPCHLWTGPTSGDGRGGGYGRMSLNGQTVAVHLVAFTHYFGYIPGKKQIDHLCNNRLCCNPQHLEMVTHLKNQKRRAKRASSSTTNSGTKIHAVITKSSHRLREVSGAVSALVGSASEERT